jgi:hypothetical protein
VPDHPPLRRRNATAGPQKYCVQCDKWVSKLRLHEERMHADTRTVYICGTALADGRPCPREYTSPEYLRNHRSNKLHLDARGEREERRPAAEVGLAARGARRRTMSYDSGVSL